MTSEGCQLLCQITSPLGGWWGREPSLGRVRLTLWSAGAGGAARDMWRNWSWCSFVCCLLPPSGHAASGQLPEAQDHGSTFFRVQPACSAHHRPKEEEEDSPLARKYNSPVLWGCSAPIRRPWDPLGHSSPQQNGHRLGLVYNLAKRWMSGEAARR